ncbi:MULTISPECIES: nuclear transport factor 2 family protein [Luteimonas]|uniref:nuclear transport factor 2 family protein n=1 Tax=Luteimonas TaxID=83614 RepID=UPI000C79DCDF|nr:MULTISPECIES: nuclear transport factor 2 family protein [Luteimonas]
MPPSLPAVVADYFRISNGGDDAALGACFTDDAVVHDEGGTHRGHADIQAWKRAARRKYDYSVTPVEHQRDGDRLTVAAELVGNFPGSPVTVDHVFELAGDRIRTLRIG